MHHSPWIAETNSNYSPVLSIWDRVFGTFRPPGDPRRVRFGLDGYTDAEHSTLLGCLATPLVIRTDGSPTVPTNPQAGAARPESTTGGSVAPARAAVRFLGTAVAPNAPG